MDGHKLTQSRTNVDFMDFELAIWNNINQKSDEFIALNWFCVSAGLLSMQTKTNIDILMCTNCFMIQIEVGLQQIAVRVFQHYLSLTVLLIAHKGNEALVQLFRNTCKSIPYHWQQQIRHIFLVVW